MNRLSTQTRTKRIAWESTMSFPTRIDGAKLPELAGMIPSKSTKTNNQLGEKDQARCSNRLRQLRRRS